MNIKQKINKYSNTLLFIDHISDNYSIINDK